MGYEMNIKPSTEEVKHKNNIKPFIEMVDYANQFISEVAKRLSEKNIYFEYPEEINIDYMMSWGITMKWGPYCGSAKESFRPILLFIENSTGDDCLYCSSLTIYNRQTQEKVYVSKVKIQIQDVVDGFVWLDEQNKNILEEIREECV